MSYLYLALHYPKPGHVQDLLGAMQRLKDALQGAPGLLHIGAWQEEATTRIVALSIWDSPEAFQGALGRIGAAVVDVPFGEWELRPRELIRAAGIPMPKPGQT
jgi:hypothetical protein